MNLFPLNYKLFDLLKLKISIFIVVIIVFKCK